MKLTEERIRAIIREELAAHDSKGALAARFDGGGINQTGQYEGKVTIVPSVRGFGKALREAPES